MFDLHGEAVGAIPTRLQHGAVARRQNRSADLRDEINTLPWGGEDKDEVKAVLDRTTREWKGWRCSYSTLEADGDKSRRFHAKLRKTQQVLGHLLRYQVESMRHASDGVLKARAVDRNGKSALRKRTEREHFRKRAGAESTDSSSSDSSS